LLLEDQKRFAEIGIAALHFLEENGNLGMLATEAEDGRAGHIGMVKVAGEEGAEIVGILARSAAAAFVREEFDAVDVAKDLGRSRRLRCFGEGECFYSFGAAFAVEPGEFRYLAAIDLRRSESKLFLERLFQDMQISVFAKDQGKNEPIIPGANLAIGPSVSKKRPAPPGRNVRRDPAGHSFLFVKRGGSVADVARGKQFSAWQILRRFADQDAVHDDVFASGEVLGDELLLGRHVGQEKIVTPGKANGFAFMQIGQGNEDVVASVES